MRIIGLHGSGHLPKLNNVKWRKLWNRMHDGKNLFENEIRAANSKII